ncbi:MAG: M24 family metallopeptidase [Eubacteriales bacterium]|nr:Xaa-Pro peptidase family protein [Bacillota bacterium]
MRERVAKLRRYLAGAGIKAFFVTSPENRFYISGFSGSAGSLLFVGDKSYLFVDFRYAIQAAQETEGYEIVEIPSQDYVKLEEIIRENNISSMAFESDQLAVSQYREMQDKLYRLELKPVSGIIETMRMNKDDLEIAAIDEAVELSDKALADILPLLRPGAKERNVALELEYVMRRYGAERAAFNIIVASGPRAALPHGVASDRLMQEGDLVILDFGAVWQGYHSDITRTVVLGQPDPFQMEIYDIVLEAQMRGVASISAGKAANDVDFEVRSVIEWYGYGKYFGHGTGHGLGLNIHEGPRLSPRDRTILKKGMVVTVEPGIYLPDWGGVRIEDTVVVEESGCRVLTRSPKEKLIICGIT